MSDTPDLVSCTDGTALLPSAPYLALYYHFGMLLGVDDFETEQAYHRGKMRLHGAWLHREGVVWGLAVSADLARGELRVSRGLALDAAGRELHLDEDACVNVGAWFAALPEAERERLGGAAGTDPFDAHVLIRHKACLTRQVPALMEPCDGAGRDTAYSRVYETVEILLVPDAPPAPPPAPYHRLRLMFGLDEARVDDDGNPLPEDQAILAERATLLAQPRETRLPAALALLRRCAAADAAALAPGKTAEGDEWLLFPASGDEGLVLAQARITLAATEGGLALGAAEVDHAERPSHVATRTIQELAAASFFCCDGVAAIAPTVRAARPAGLRADPTSVEFKARTVSFTVSSALHADTVTPAAFAVSALVADSGWKTHKVTSAAFDAATRTVRLEVQPQLKGALFRLVALGTGPTPLLAADFGPFAGATTDAPAAAGRDFVFMKEGS